MSRNQKTWIISDSTGPVVAFDNESAAYESHDALQTGVMAHNREHDDSEVEYFSVKALPIRMNKLNAETIRKLVSER